jgi:hypothetical protein
LREDEARGEPRGMSIVGFLTRKMRRREHPWQALMTCRCVARARLIALSASWFPPSPPPEADVRRPTNPLSTRAAGLAYKFGDPADEGRIVVVGSGEACSCRADLVEVERNAPPGPVALDSHLPGYTGKPALTDAGPPRNGDGAAEPN